MEVLYKQGKAGQSIDAQYVCDRLKGKPGVKIDLEIGVKPYDTLIKEISLQAHVEPVILIEGGNDAIQEPGNTEGSEQTSQPEIPGKQAD